MIEKVEDVDVLIVGAGIIGSTLAYELQKSGRKVLMIDRGDAGLGCSYGNAGWITPCFAMPLPQPGMLMKSIGWMLHPEGPLYIKPEINLRLFRWMVRFLRDMNEKKMRSSIEVLTDISKYSLHAYREMAEKRASQGKGSVLDFRQNGLLMVSNTPQGMKDIEFETRLMAEHGIPGKSLGAKEVLDLEPSLKSIVLGGTYFPTEASIEPLQAVRAFLEEFESLGGQFQAKTEVYDFITQGDRIEKVVTTRGRFKPKLLVLATGPWSPQMAKKLKVNIPILGGKGYSLIVDEFETLPQHPMMLIDRKIAVTPRNGSVRLAGTLELVDGDESITPRRVNAVLKGSHLFLKMSQTPKVHEVWRGLRPCTPDGVPMLGYSQRWKNLFYSMGHQMLGLQTAPGSARFCAELILEKKPYTNTKPFDPARFE